jgi:ATP-dependent Clp endopeptidase proteolytic subunit ClpP
MDNRDFLKVALEDDFNAEDRIGIKLLDSSIHFLQGDIDEETVGNCVKWIVYENLNPKLSKVLTLYSNSTGGDLYQAFALIDVMRNSKLPIRVIGLGSVMSAAFLIFACGTPGERHAGAHTSFMSHQFSSGSEAKYHDIKAEMKENESLNAKMVEILQAATGLTAAKVKSKLLPASDVYLSAEEAVALNIADHIF